MTDINPLKRITTFDVSGSDKQLTIYVRSKPDGWYEYIALHGNEPVTAPMSSNKGFEDQDLAAKRYIAKVEMYFKACGARLSEIKP